MIITGVSGFLGSHLVERLKDDEPQSTKAAAVETNLCMESSCVVSGIKSMFDFATTMW